MHTLRSYMLIAYNVNTVSACDVYTTDVRYMFSSSRNTIMHVFTC